jgi:phage recombination protein Bet
MSGQTALVKQEQNGLVYRPEQIQLIKDVYAKGASDNELALFIEVAQRKGLDIFSRQVHLVKRYDSQLQREVMEPQTGIDGYRLMAERTGKYEGQLGPFWCGSDGEWKDVWLSDGPPAAAKVGTLKTGCREPFYAVALYKEYVQTKRDGTPNSMWKKMAANQLAKCAEALSLRKAFPGDLAGIYTAEEMAQSLNPAASDGTREPEDETPRNGKSAPVKAGPVSAAETALNEKLLAHCIKEKGDKNGVAFFESVYAKKSAADKAELVKSLGLADAPQVEPTAVETEVIEGEVVELGPDHGKVLDLTEALKELGQSYEQVNEKIAKLCGGVYAVEELDAAQAAKAAGALAKWCAELRGKADRK